MAVKKISLNGFVDGIKKVGKGLAPFVNIAKTVLSVTPLGGAINMIGKTASAAKGIANAIKAAKAVKDTVAKGKAIAASLKAAGVEPTPKKVATIQAASESNKPIVVTDQKTVLARAEKAATEQAKGSPASGSPGKSNPPKQGGKKAEFYALFGDEGDGSNEDVAFIADDATLTFFKAEKKSFLDNIVKVDKNLDTLKAKIKRVKAKAMRDSLLVEHQDMVTALANFKKEIKAGKTLDDEVVTPYILITPASARNTLKMYNVRLEQINKKIVEIDNQVNATWEGRANVEAGINATKSQTSETQAQAKLVKAQTSVLKNKTLSSGSAGKMLLAVGAVAGIGALVFMLRKYVKKKK